MKKSLLALGVFSLLLLGCQDNTGNPKTDNAINTPTEIKNTPDLKTDTPITATTEQLTTDDIIQNKTVDFIRVQGHYPFFIDTAYQSLNDEIKAHIDELVKFDNSVSTENAVGGVDKLEYLVLNFDENQLSLQMDYHLNDMTARYFEKYYQIDLKNKKKVALSDYLKDNGVNVDDLNKAINDYVIPCKEGENKPEHCQNIDLNHLLNLFEFNNDKVDVLTHSDGFYVVDKDHIVIAFNSTKFTSKFKVNLKNFKVDFN